MNKKSIFEILKWANVTLELGTNLAKVFGKGSTRQDPEKPAQPDKIKSQQVGASGWDNPAFWRLRSLDGCSSEEMIKAYIQDYTVDRFKRVCNMVIHYKNQGNTEAMKKSIDEALRIFREWVYKYHPSENLIERESDLMNPRTLLAPKLKSNNSVAYNELKDMLPLLEEILKYKT